MEKDGCNSVHYGPALCLKCDLINDEKECAKWRKQFNATIFSITPQFDHDELEVLHGVLQDHYSGTSEYLTKVNKLEEKVKTMLMEES